MFKILIPAVAIVGLAAFAAQTQPVMGGVDPANNDPTMTWHLSTEGPVAKLAYGVAHSDFLAMMVTCAPGDETAEVYGDVKPVNARAEKDSPFGEAKIAVGDAGLRDLAEKGAIRVSGEAGVFNLRASPQERRAIGQFLSYCGRKGA